jgi:tRNA(adenine34) deaminase
MYLDPENVETYMTYALALADRAADVGEVPVGAVVVKGGVVISEAHNEVESRQDPTAHAEVLALQRAAASLGNWRLSGCILCVTVEPCLMCGGALLLARIPLLIYGTSEPRTGAFGSQRDLAVEEKDLRVIRGIQDEPCAARMKAFFSSRRLT